MFYQYKVFRKSTEIWLGGKVHLSIGLKNVPERNMEITSLIRKKSGIEAVDLAGEKVITDFNAGNYYMLTGVGGVIWNMLEKETTPEQIIRDLLAEYNVTEDVCRADVMEYLNEVEKLGYIEVVG